MRPVFCLLTILGLLIPIHPTFAREGRIHFGMLAAGSIKYQFLQPSDRNYHLFGDLGFGAMARITGHSEGALSFQPKILFLRENIGYHQTNSAKYYIESINLVFNPEIIFPTLHDRWNISGGIGLDWALENNLAVSGRTGNQISGNLLATYEVVNEHRRPLIPFISTGLVYWIKGGLYAQLTLRQDLLNAFPEHPEVTFISSADVLSLRLSHQPTRLGLGLFYLF